MDRLDLLKHVTFGAQVAEEETSELASYFVETDQWSRIFGGKIDIVRGEKGAGKSAIYALLLERKQDLFDKGVVVVAAENPRGATVFRDLVADPPTSEVEFVVLWKLYVLAIVAQQLREFGVSTDGAKKVYGILEDEELLEAKFSLARLLRIAHAYARRLVQADAIEAGVSLDPVTGVPDGVTGKITLKEPTNDQLKRGLISVDNLFAILDGVLKETGFEVWVLLDRLDVAFIENHELEANALRALIRAYADMRSSDNISLKIFLREDIWKRITEGGFREASHLIRYVVLDWTPPALLNLIMRRLLSNRELTKEFGIDVEAILRDADQQEDLFYRFFPKQVEQGPQKAPTFKWLITRCADGTKKTAPRELVHLLNSIREQEIKRLEHGESVPPDEQLFDRSVFKLALPVVSDARLHQYMYAEYPQEKPFLSKLDGQKTEQTLDSLSDLWKLEKEQAIGKARELVELGFFEERGTREEPTFWVPFLYRDALHLIQGKAEADDD